MNCDLLIHAASQLVTCASGGKPKRGSEMCDVGVIRNGAIAAKGNKIIAVGSTSDLISRFKPERSVDAGGKIVCPGLVDAHSHLVYAGDRLDEFELKIKGAEYLDILASGGGIISTVRRTRLASIEELVEPGLKRLDKMLSCGTTTCEIKTGYGLDTETELKMLAVIEVLDSKHPIDIVPTFLAAHTIPPEFNGRSDEYVDHVCEEMLPLAWKWYSTSRFFDLGRPFSCDIFTEKNAFNVPQMVRLFEAAKCLGFGLKAHVDQFTNLGGSGAAIRMGAVSVDHLDEISDEEAALLAESESVGVVIPTENFNAGKRKFADARKMIDGNCAIAISTDYNPGSAPCPSLPMAMAIACRYQKLLPSEAMNAATVNAAFAIGLGKTHGSIEVGKQADLLIIDTEDYRELSYEFGAVPKMSIVKNGKYLGD
jgi:imidazolonepropionase